MCCALSVVCCCYCGLLSKCFVVLWLLVIAGAVCCYVLFGVVCRCRCCLILSVVVGRSLIGVVCCLLRGVACWCCEARVVMCCVL